MPFEIADAECDLIAAWDWSSGTKRTASCRADGEVYDHLSPVMFIRTTFPKREERQWVKAADTVDTAGTLAISCPAAAAVSAVTTTFPEGLQR